MTTTVESPLSIDQSLSIEKMASYSLDEHTLWEERTSKIRTKLEKVILRLMHYMQWVKESGNTTVHGFILVEYLHSVEKRIRTHSLFSKKNTQISLSSKK